MKTLLTFIFAGLTISVSAIAETSPVYFRGILNLGTSQNFSLATEGGAESAWVSVGDSFNGYKVAEFDEEANVLILRKDDEELRLELAGAGGAEPGKPEDTARAQAEELLRSMKFDEMMEQSMEQQKEMMEKMFRQSSQQMGFSMTEDELARQMEAVDRFTEAMDWEGMKEDMIQAYSEVFTPEELRGLIDFYSTAAGQGFIEKQDELMQRASELMQPRLMHAMARMQETMMQPAPTPVETAP